MKRGEVAVFKAGESYEPPAGAYFVVAVKPNHPPVKSPPEIRACDCELARADHSYGQEHR